MDIITASTSFFEHFVVNYTKNWENLGLKQLSNILEKPMTLSRQLGQKDMRSLRKSKELFKRAWECFLIMTKIKKNTYIY